MMPVTLVAKFYFRNNRVPEGSEIHARLVEIPHFYLGRTL
jgi:hypothetical protein